MLRVMTFNLNGIRSAARKGFFTWLRAHEPDVLCLQETKAQEHQVFPEMVGLAGYHAVFVDAQRKGYSGVAIYSRRAPDAVARGFDLPDIDAEGRFVRFDYGNLSIASLYIPSGTSGPARQAVKDGFLERFLPLLAAMRADGRSYILCGDWNIAHCDIDTFDPVRNARITGFLPHERSWFETVVEGLGWVDAFRVVDPNPKRYTWWPSWARAFERNLGWRIDYQLVTPDLAPSIRTASIARDVRFSDHAPLTIDYEMDFEALSNATAPAQLTRSSEAPLLPLGVSNEPGEGGH